MFFLCIDWSPLFTNANDKTNEGIVHNTKRIFTTQFHPEHSAGPEDTECLFDVFLDLIKDEKASAKEAIKKRLEFTESKVDDNEERPHKVLVLGSGGLSIGDAFFSSV